MKIERLEWQDRGLPCIVASGRSQQCSAAVPDFVNQVQLSLHQTVNSDDTVLGRHIGHIDFKFGQAALGDLRDRRS